MPAPRLPMRGSSLAAAVGGLLALGVVLALLHAAHAQEAGAQRQQQARQWVRELGLTDLSLFTEARYARHLSQADLHSALQDGPGALEHFPAGSLVSPVPPRAAAGFVGAPR